MIVTSSCSPLRRIARASKEVCAATGHGGAAAARRARPRCSSQVPSGQVEEDVLEGAAADGEPTWPARRASASQAVTAATAAGRRRPVTVYAPPRGSLTTQSPPARSAGSCRSRPGGGLEPQGPVLAPGDERRSRTLPAAMTRPWSTTTHVVGEVLGLVHEVGGQHDGDAVVAQLAHQVPDGAPGSAGPCRRWARRGTRPRAGRRPPRRARAADAARRTAGGRWCARTTQAEALGELVHGRAGRRTSGRRARASPARRDARSAGRRPAA